MKLHTLGIFCLVGVALAISPQGPPPAAPQPLARLMPSGSLLYIASPDFAALLHDWSDSREKQAWLASDNDRVFSRSRLYLRLQDAQAEFADAAGAPPNMALLNSVAGTRSALALYDIGNLAFLYITRLPEARAMDNALWLGKDKFEPRQAAGFTYYVHTEPSKNRLVAFAAARDYLFLATREDLMAGALTALAGRPQRTLADEDWYRTATSTAGPAGDLRLVSNLSALVKTPHFRSYWIQRNVSAIREYSAEVADIRRSPDQIREERVLVRNQSGAETMAKQPENDTAVSDLLRLVPDASDVYRAWASPSVARALELLERKILAPRSGPGVASNYAPGVTLTAEQTGGEGDLETRIDVPPLTGTAGAFEPAELQKWLEGSKLTGTLEIESAPPLEDGVFAGTQSAIVLESAADWNAEAARAALLASIENLWTTSGIGIKWVERGGGAAACFALNGLTPLAMAARGRLLIVGTGSGPVEEALRRISKPPANVQGVYAAGFRHAAARQDLVKMMRLIEAPWEPRSLAAEQPGGHEPLFFSENLASLSKSLARVQSESIVVQDRGPLVSQTVVYRLSP